MLNSEFFEEVRKASEDDISATFGHKVGNMLKRHAEWEEKFQSLCVEDGVKMTDIDELMEDGRAAAVELKKSTMKLVRVFNDQEMILRLKACQ